LGVADASPELLDAVIRMLRLLDSPGDREVLAPMVEREILWRLIAGPLGETVRQIGIADSSLTQISHAVRWITDHFDEPFRVEDLARPCGMSASAFHRNFNAATTLSPIKFQKQIRLQQARLMLPGRLRERLSVQPRVPPPVRPVAGPRCRAAAERGNSGLREDSQNMTVGWSGGRTTLASPARRPYGIPPRRLTGPD
jgi:hypothetical protein